MKKALRIATLITLALIFCSNTVWAAAESGIASAPGPEAMFLFGTGLLGLAFVSRFRFKI